LSCSKTKRGESLHAARQDLEIFRISIPVSLFDGHNMVGGAMVCGFMNKLVMRPCEKFASDNRL
jgi:hypothetical protein